MLFTLHKSKRKEGKGRWRDRWCYETLWEESDQVGGKGREGREEGRVRGGQEENKIRRKDEKGRKGIDKRGE